MTDTQDIEFVIQYTDDAQKAIQSISDWGRKVDMLARAGADLTKIEQVLKGFGIFRLATGSAVVLGVFSGGLQIVGHLLGMKSIEQQILDATQDISSQVATLSQQLDDVYEQIVMQLDLHSARDQISPAVNLLDTLKTQVDEYVQRLQDGKPTGDIESRFPQSDPRPQIQAAVTKICGAATASGNQAQYNLLQPVYDLSYGMFEQVLEQGNYLLQYALTGLYLDGFFTAYKYGKSPGPNGVQADLAEAQETATSLYGKMIDALSAAIQACAQRCKDDVEANLARLVDVEYNHKVEIGDHDQYQALGDALIVRLRQQWTWLAWLVVVNDEASGYEDHGVGGPSYWTYWHQKFGTKKKEMQLTIAYADRGSTTVITDALKDLTREYVHRMLKKNAFGTHHKDDDDMKKILEDFLHDARRPRTGTLRYCWHDMHMTASCSDPHRFFVHRPKEQYNTNAYGDPMKQEYYHAVLFV